MSKKITIIGAPKHELHRIIPPDPKSMKHIPFIITPKTDPVLDTPEKIRAFLEECDRINGFSPEIK